MKNLKCVTKEEQIEFFNSFDKVLCDVDGVLWHYPNLIPKADSAIASLQNLNKKVIFVSNKTTKSHEDIYQNLKIHFHIEKNDLIMPETAIISHLKKINFNENIYFIGMAPLKTALINAGFRICNYNFEFDIKSVTELAQASLKNNEKVGAVITDIDANVNYIKLQKAAIYLQDSKVRFITGNSSSKHLNVQKTSNLFNSWYFDKILEDFTRRKPLRLAKPSLDYNEFIKEVHEIENPYRVLFIGDSIEDDMNFATNCGYKKLLVLSGVTSKEMLNEWEEVEKVKPHYYIDSLKDINDLINCVYKKSC